MSLSVTCPACSKTYSFEDRLAGQNVPCPRCAFVLAISGSACDVPGSPEPSSHLTMEAPAFLGDFTDYLRPAEAADEIGRLGTFRILKVLGAGGMGIVFLAEDVKLQRQVAVKSMQPGVLRDPQAGQRFLREARAMAKVEHPHVARIYQVDEENGVPFLAMEFLKGEPLDERLRREPTLPLPEATRIARQVADGLAAAHALGLVHRDIKPANIWLESPSGFVKILDFGLARAERPDRQVTEQGIILGTPAFMAPEQSKGAAVDARTDLFSLGVVLSRMTTGQIPFVGTDAISTMVAVASATPVTPRALNPDVPPELESLILKLLAKAPADRYSSAEATRQALGAIERKSEWGSGESTRTVLQKPSSLLRGWFGAIVAVALLAAGVGVFAWWRLGERGDPLAEMPKPRTIEPKSPSPFELLTSADYEWSAPVRLGAALNDGRRVLNISLTEDERIAVFSRDGVLCLSRRDRIDQPFPRGKPLPASITDLAGEVSSISGDGRLLVFSSNSVQRGMEDIWMAVRESVDEPFSPPVCLPAPVNTPGSERAPVLSADGLTLLLTTIGRGAGNGQIVKFTRPSRDQNFSNESVLPEPVNTDAYDVADWFSPDGRLLIATKMATPPFEARLFPRTNSSSPFGSPVPIVVPGVTIGRPWVSPDGSRMYFHTRDFPASQGVLNLFMSRRVPRSK